LIHFLKLFFFKKNINRGSDEDIVSLQEKVLALQTQISSHKQLK